MKTIIICLILLISVSVRGQEPLPGFPGGYEKLNVFRDVGVTEIKVGDSIVKVEPHFIKDAWLPDGTQIIKNGFGYRQYQMWGYTRRYHYQYGEANGPFYFYDSVGRTVKSGECLNGEIHGNFYTYHENGQVAIVEKRNLGKHVSTEYFHENGSFKSRSTFNNEGQRVGNYIEYYDNGNIKVKGQFAAEFNCIYFDKDSLSKEMEPDPEMIAIGFPEGEWIEYYSDGSIQKKDYFCGCYWHWEKQDMGEFPPFYSIIKNPCPCNTSMEIDENGRNTKSIEYTDCFPIIK